MDFDEDKILSIANKARELGIELFVLDGGWFEERDDGATPLGDWYPDLHKLPDEITGLAGKIGDTGMRFGLWFEPEIVNRDSRFYRAHPNWMLGSTDRPVCTGRYQYALDFSKDQVVEYIKDRMEEILGDDGASYVKWGMNKSISDLLSVGRDAQYQETMYHRQILGVYKLYDRLIGSFPHVLFESCASGGVRSDLGTLYYVPRGQTSDDTDGAERVKIQHGISLVYLLSSMGSHVSATPNHQTQRNIPLTARAAAARFRIFGYELDLSLLVKEEQYQVKEQIWFIKEHRRLIQQGRFYQPMSPSEENEAAQIMISEDADKAIAVYSRLLQPVNVGSKRLILRRLNPGIMYQVSGVDYTAYGDELMGAGLILSGGASDARTSSVPQGDYLSRLFLVGVQP